jgi:hypothetical protein
MWRVWVRRGGRIGSWWGNRREKDHWGDLGVDGWIILKWICETSFETAWFRMTLLKYKEKWRAVLNKVLELQVAYSGVNCLTTF